MALRMEREEGKASVSDKEARHAPRLHSRMCCTVSNPWPCGGLTISSAARIAPSASAARAQTAMPPSTLWDKACAKKKIRWDG